MSLRVAGAEVEDWVWDACVEGVDCHGIFYRFRDHLDTSQEFTVY